MRNVFSEITTLVLAALTFPMQTNWNFLALLLLLLSPSFVVAFFFDSSKDLNAPVSLIRGSKPVVSPEECLVSLMSRSSGERKKMNYKLLDIASYQMK